MKLQQLRYIWEVAHHDLNVSATAQSLFTSQPGISKQIRLLEDELGVEIFARSGKHLTHVTAVGETIIAMAGQILRQVETIKQVAQEYSDEQHGNLSIATTHTQARYALPRVIQQFAQRYPGVRLSLRQGSPTEICRYVIAGEADIAIATEAIEHYEELVMLPCYQWNRCVVAPPDHPILKAKPLTLEAIARYPIVTYDFAFAGRSQINKAFASRGLAPNVVLTAIDTDVIKTYVALGLGIGIIAAMAYDRDADKGLVAVDAAHLFESATTRIGLRRNDYLRGYTYAFIELFAPHLGRKSVEAALRGGGTDPGL